MYDLPFGGLEVEIQSFAAYQLGGIHTDEPAEMLVGIEDDAVRDAADQKGDRYFFWGNRLWQKRYLSLFFLQFAMSLLSD